MTVGIYKFENKINGHIYIGQSKNIERRYNRHIAASINSNDKSYNYPLERAIRKYGIENINFLIIEECKIEQLDNREIYWINYYNSYFSGYNQTLGGSSGGSSQKITPEMLLEITNTLKNTNLKHQEIANMFGVLVEMIQGINTGRYWRREIKYPIRKNRLIKSKKQKKYYYKLQNYCPICGKIISRQAKKCLDCENNSRKKEHNFIEIAQSIKEIGIVKTGEKYGVSHTTVSRWFKKENLPYTKNEIIKWYNEQLGIKEEKKVKYLIQQLDKDTLEVIGTFSTPTAAAQALGDVKKSSHISAVCNGKRLTAYGFKWQYKEIN